MSLCFVINAFADKINEPEPVCDDYIASSNMTDLFLVTQSIDCEGDAFNIKSMLSDSFYTTDMEQLRPLHYEELQE